LKKLIYHRIWPYFHPIRSLEWRELKSFAHNCPGCKVLSLGCGTGFFENRMRNRCPVQSVFGIDLSYAAIAEARKFHRKPGIVDFCLGDACQLPFENESFNAVIGLCTFEHFSEPHAVLDEIVRVLRPRGKLWLSVDAFDHPSISKSYREKFRGRHNVINFFPLEDLSALLAKHGFRVEQYRYLLRSKGAGWVYQINSEIKSKGWEVIEPITFLLLRALIVFSEKICGTEDSGYILTISGRLIEQ
ncbi:MAG: class I SAM-dependent methyltransferase, partial [Planctomycetota bacterium]